MSELPGYDAWLEKPYQERYAKEPEGECPECGAAVIEDDFEKSAECTECEWSAGVDWDAMRERDL